MQMKTLPIAAQPVPTEFNEYLRTLDPHNAYIHPYHGLFVQPVTVDGQKRIIKGYLPEGLPHCTPSLFLAAPSGVDVETFMELTGWRELADRKRFALFLFEPLEGQWAEQDAEQEIRYMLQAHSRILVRDVFSIYTSNFYFAGYGDGGEILHKFILRNPYLCSGMAIFNGSKIDKAFLEETMKCTKFMPILAEEGTMNPYLKAPLTQKKLGEIEAPVWVIEDALEERSRQVVEYWLRANHCVLDCFSTPDADVYFQSPVSIETWLDSMPLGRVQVTERKVDCGDKAFHETLWDDFFIRTGRYRHTYEDKLRPLSTPEELGLVRQETEVDGKLRYWWEYIPSYAKAYPKEALPVVMAFHGGGQIPECYIAYTDWHKLAEERHFIMLYPAAWPAFKFAHEVARPFWNDDFDEKKADDFAFFRRILDHMESRQPIHRGKIYATGHSSGGAMSQRVALEMPDVFTAMAANAAPIMGCFIPNFTFPATYKPEYKMPVWTTKGENDGGPTRKNRASIYTLEHWLRQNDCGELENIQSYRSGLYNHIVYRNKEGVPLVRHTLIRDKGHTTMPSESRMYWDEFFCKFTRDEKGNIHYMEDEVFW